MRRILVPISSRDPATTTQHPSSGELAPSPQQADSPKNEPQWQIFAAGVRLMALRALGDATAADDVAQETIARALGVLRSEGGRQIADLGAFIHGIARHVIADVQRARHGHHGSDLLELLPDPRPDALSQAVSADERQRLRRALDSLAVSDRKLLELCYVTGLGAVEIAERLREPPERIRKRKSRALARLRDAFLKLRGHGSEPKTTSVQ